MTQSKVEVTEPYITRERYEMHLQHIRNNNIITVDTEGTLNHPFCATWGLSTSAQGVGDYFAFNHILGNNLPQEWLPEIIDALQDKILVMHHAKHDIRSLQALGLKKPKKWYCTLLMSHMINENRYAQKLESLAKEAGGTTKRNDELMQQFIKGFGWEYIPVELIREYGQDDAKATEDVFNWLWPDFVHQGFNGELWDIEQEFAELLADMEDTGILVDQDLSWRELNRGLTEMREIKSFLGFDPAKSSELGKFFLEEMNLPVLKESKKTGKPSFDKKVLEAYDEILQQTNDRRAQAVLTYRGWQKTTSSNYQSYLEKLHPEDGRIRPNFKQHGTKTGRTSCENPNLQQIPRSSAKDWNGKLKQAFISPEGFSGWEFDYSQLEMRLLAAYIKDEGLLGVFRDDSRDLFDEMAANLGMKRGAAKTLNYAIGYGAAKTRISNIFNVSELAAAGIIGRYYKQYPGIKRFSNLCQRRAQENGYVKYWTGRRRHFLFESEYHKAGNSAIQGGAFEIVKRQSLAVKRAGLITDECQLNLTVHDSLRFDILKGKEKEYIPEIKRVLENVKPDFGVPFRVDFGQWGSSEKWDLEKLDKWTA